MIQDESLFMIDNKFNLPKQLPTLTEQTEAHSFVESSIGRLKYFTSKLNSDEILINPWNWQFSVH